MPNLAADLFISSAAIYAFFSVFGLILNCIYIRFIFGELNTWRILFVLVSSIPAVLVLCAGFVLIFLPPSHL